jgi:PKD repeat protein
MIKQYFLFLLIFVPVFSFAQYPPLEMNIATVTSGATGTVDVAVTAGTNWQNITQVQGTFTFNPAIITWNSMQNWGLSNPGGAVFTNSAPGVVTFVWQSLFTIGPTLSNGALVFNLRFNVVGSVGSFSPVNFINSPQATFWANGFAWQGPNFTIGIGAVNVGCVGPQASFTSSTSYLTSSFTNTSVAGTSYTWNFGDGNSSTSPSPTHTYTANGNYTACLITTNTCGADTACQVITAQCFSPTAAFTQSTNQLIFTGTNTSGGLPSTYLWDYGDGTTSNSQNANHTYAAPGTYNVCLTVSNPCGTNTVCQPVIITCTYPVSSWTSASGGLVTNFINGSSGLPTSYLWDFGNGITSTLTNPTHTYTVQGSYSVCLTATNICGSNTSCQTINIVCPTPSTNFSSTSNLLTATFTDISGNTPTSWLWNFGDGGVSSLQNPTHVYANAGTYNVCLVTGNACGLNTFCQNVTIICTNPVAGFSQSSSGYVGTFTNSSASATSWLWDFGDGTTSTLQNPTHTYGTEGTFQVCLTATNQCGSNTTCSPITISCPNPVSNWTFSAANETLTFTDVSTNTPTTWAWDFGDGGTSNVQNPTHTYTIGGPYQVCLVASSGCGSDNHCQIVTVGITGLEDISFSDVQISPNPAIDDFQINTSFEGLMNVKLYDLTGKLITDTNVSNEQAIDLRGLAEGSYVVKIAINGHETVRRLIHN